MPGSHVESKRVQFLMKNSGFFPSPEQKIRTHFA